MSFDPSRIICKINIKMLLIVVLAGLFVVGCGERPNETGKSGAVSCNNPGKPIILAASKYDPVTKQGWLVNGTSFPEQKKDVPMGRFDNQILADVPVQAGATAAQIKVQVAGTVPTAALILDTIWYNGSAEIGRSSPSIELGKTMRNVITTTQPVLPSADRLVLSARPWREVDGILTIGEGEIVWCNK